MSYTLSGPNGESYTLYGPGEEDTQQPAPQNAASAIVNSVSDAVKNSPLGMVASGANTINKAGEYLTTAGKFAVPDFVKKAGNIVSSLTTRPGKALGVLAANVAEPQQALGLPAVDPNKDYAGGVNRAAAAMKPDFKPKNKAEEVGGQIGEAAAMAGLSAIPGGAIGQAATATGLMAAKQAGEEGKVSGALLATGAAVPLAVGAVKAVGMAKDAFMSRIAAVQAAGKADEFAATKAADLADNFSRQFQATISDIEQKKAALGVTESPAEIADRIRTFGKWEGKKPLNYIQKELDSYRAPAVEKPSPIVSEYGGRDVPQAAAPRVLSDRDKLHKLALLDQQVNHKIDWTNPGSTKEALTLKNQIRKEISALGDPGKEYIRLSADESRWLKMSGQMKAALENADTAKAFLQKTAKSGLRGSFSVQGQKQVKALRQFEQVSGQQYLDPVKNAIKSQAATEDQLAAQHGLLRNVVGLVSPRLRYGMDAASIAMENLLKRRGKI